jgi:DNA-binding NarL/FixJ family response regulator
MISRFRRPGGGAAKPRVLLVDDHPAILTWVSSLLADDFLVAGMVTDGRAAVQTARRIDPDVIVLDVNMPDIDGFEICSALQSNKTRAPVVFLSMVDESEFVQEAFRRGGRGYVLKSHMVRDLGSALDQVLLGRLFAPSLTSMSRQAHRGAHGMHLYGDGQSVIEGLASLFDLALRRGDATCVIATEDVRDGLAVRLHSLGWAVDGPSGHPRYRSLDARDALSGIMRDGLPDAGLLANIAAELDEYRRRTTETATSRLTLFGTLAGLLVAEGNAEGAIALETLWNSVTEHLPFLTVCGYAAGCFHEDVPDLWSRASAAHWAVSHAGSF